MRVLLQRVQHVSVHVNGATTENIQRGFLLLVGVIPSDTEDITRKMAGKCAQLRVLKGKNGKISRGLQDIGDSTPSISQFTLCADYKRERRPGFKKTAYGDFARPIYHTFNEELRTYGIRVETGISGAGMKMDLLNDGPVTILLGSEEWQEEV